MTRKLFNADETYNDLGREVSGKATAFAEELLRKYPDVLTRELAQIAYVAIEMATVTIRLERGFGKRKREEEPLPAGAPAIREANRLAQEELHFPPPREEGA
jgi:hypothetical protein